MDATKSVIIVQELHIKVAEAVREARATFVSDGQIFHPTQIPGSTDELWPALFDVNQSRQLDPAPALDLHSLTSGARLRIRLPQQCDESCECLYFTYTPSRQLLV